MTRPAAAAPLAPHLPFRRDIEGLRALAVLLVIAVHFGITTVSGGFIGVDVFFVISGFLITSLLITEFHTSNRVSLPRFYARRARRILPVACFVISATVVATYLQLGPLAGKSTAVDGQWAAGFAANVRFIHQGTNYFAQNTPPSPLQHYWSLAVEEQFYLVWPTFVFALVLLGRRFHRSTSFLRCGLAAMLAGSLYWSIHQSAIDPTAAYFSPLTRAWELGAGALVAAFAANISGIPRTLRAVAGWVGVALVAYAALTFTALTEFPGYAALLPVIGTMLVIAGGIADTTGGVGAVLGLPPVRWIGMISFSLYLWHWPVLMIAQQRSVTPLGIADRLLCALITVALSVATYYAIERPLRSRRRLEAGTRRSLRPTSLTPIAFGGLAIMLTFAISAYTGERAAFAIRSAARRTVRPASSLRTNPTSTPTEQVAALQAQVRALVQRGLTLTQIPANVDPPVLQLQKEGFDQRYVKCLQGPLEVRVRTCTFGAVQSQRVLAVLGDSHAMTWMPALDTYGARAGYRVVTVYKSACPVPSVEVFLPTPLPNLVRKPFPQCTTWRRNAVRYLQDLKPAVIVMNFAQQDMSRTGQRDVARWRSGLVTSLRKLLQSQARIVELENNTDLTQDPSVCLARPGANPGQCTATFVRREFSDAERAAARSLHVAFIDTEDWFCAQGRCPLIIDGRIAYHDADHVSAQYASDLEPLLTASLRANGLR